MINKEKLFSIFITLILISCTKSSNELSYDCGFYQVTISEDKKILTQKRTKPVDNYERYFYAENTRDNKISFLDGNDGYWLNVEDSTLYTWSIFARGEKEYCTKKQ